MSNKKWLDASQPQTLQIAVWLQYINAVLAILFLLLGSAIALLAVAQGVAAYGIANEKRWAYWLGVGLAILVCLTTLLSLIGLFGGGLGGLIEIAWSGALVALLLHPMSRRYQKIWFH